MEMELRLNGISFLLLSVVICCSCFGTVCCNDDAKNNSMETTSTSNHPDRAVQEWRSFFDNLFTYEEPSSQVSSRTFGHAKRIQFMLMPLMYKMGVMMTMLVVLTVISLKSLMIGSILLVLKLGSFLAKFHSSSPHGQVYSGPPIHYHVHPGAQPQPYHAWAPPSGPMAEDDHSSYYYKG